MISVIKVILMVIAAFWLVFCVVHEVYYTSISIRNWFNTKKSHKKSQQKTCDNCEKTCNDCEKRRKWWKKMRWKIKEWRKKHVISHVFRKLVKKKHVIFMWKTYKKGIKRGVFGPFYTFFVVILGKITCFTSFFFNFLFL